MKAMSLNIMLVGSVIVKCHCQSRFNLSSLVCDVGTSAVRAAGGGGSGIERPRRVRAYE